MTTALYRLAAPVLDRIPDISDLPPRRRAAIGIVASVLFHLLVILVVVLIGAMAPKRIDFAKAKPKPREIELTIVPPPLEDTVVPFTLAQKPDQPFLDSSGLNVAKDPALNAIFQSDENMQAASDRPATGDIPLPSQDGRDRPFNAFKTQKSLLGSVTDLLPPTADTTPPQQPPTPAPSEPKMAQERKPETETNSPPKPIEKTEVATATPPPLKAVSKPREDEIALATKAFATPPSVSKIIRSTPRPIEQQAMLTTPPPRPQSAKSGYQPEQEQNRIEGSISNRGAKSVDAVATPLAKFRKQVNSIIGSRWLAYVKGPRSSDFALGSTTIDFFITTEGKVQGVRIGRNSSNQSFADICVAAISDAQRNDTEFFQPPAGALEAMRDGRLEYSITFTLYSFQQ